MLRYKKHLNKQMGEKIKLLRESMGYTQGDLALMLGLKSFVSLCNIEAGRNGIRISELLKLCAIFKCGPEKILPEVPGVKIVRVRNKKSNKGYTLSAKFKFK